MPEQKLVMICEGWANGAPCELVGQYLEWYDPNLPADKPLAGWTNDPRKAIGFKNTKEAIEMWQRVRDVDPVRPDGKPNRPLTAFSISVANVDVVEPKQFDPVSRTWTGQ